jgi:hypothetical protein
MMQELSNDDTGRHLITTATATATGSEYLVDLTSRTVRRRMAATTPIVDFLDVGLSQLRP